MAKFLQERTLCRIFNAMAVILFAVLFYFCLIMTGENSGGLMDERIFFKKDSVFLNIMWICAALFCLYWIGKISGKFRTVLSRDILCVVISVLIVGISIWWMHSTKTEPQADQMMVSYFATCFNNGDFSGLSKGQYVSNLPYQLGLITFLRLLYKIFGEGNYESFQYLVIFLIPLFIFSGCRIVRILSDDNVKAELYYLLAVFFCFPMYAYTIFVYGDLISVILGFFGMWMYLSCLQCFSWKKLVLYAGSIGIAVQLREGMLIFVIALVITGLVKLLSDRNRYHLMMVAGLLAGVAVMQLAVWWIYHDVKPRDSEGIPASLVVVMGLDDGEQRAGWFNRYHYDTFEAVNFEAKPAKEKAYADLRNYIILYKNSPGYMLDFFKRKMLTQWEAPMYQSIVMNSRVVGEQSPLIQDIFNRGRVAKIIETEMKIYQLLLYGSILFLLVVKRKDIIKIEKYTLLIAVFGGFLFTLVWEAKTRYVLPYFLMQMPYMVIGLSEITLLPKKWAERYKK